MTKVYPNSSIARYLPKAAAPRITKTGVDHVSSRHGSGVSADNHQAPAYTSNNNNGMVVLTVWKKSLLLNCNGFTVFDSKGNLLFRVDNYVTANRGEIVLMDASGKPLLTIRRKRLSFGDSWLVFDGETTTNPIFSVRKNVNLLNTKTLAHVFREAGNRGGRHSNYSTNTKKSGVHYIYEIEGSYPQRNVAVYDNKRRRVAEIKRKESTPGGVTLGFDVFSLILHPDSIMDTALAMALIIVLEQMFGSSSSSPRRLSF